MPKTLKIGMFSRLQTCEPIKAQLFPFPWAGLGVLFHDSREVS